MPQPESTPGTSASWAIASNKELKGGRDCGITGGHKANCIYNMPSHVHHTDDGLNKQCGIWKASLIYINKN